MSAVATRARPLPDTIGQLTPGLLVFCARPSPLQRLMHMVGDEWRHVGMTIETEDGLGVAGFARSNQYAVMPLEKLLTYNRVGIASFLDSEQEIENFQRWVSQFESLNDAAYPTGSLFVSGAYSNARRRGRLRHGLLRRLSLRYSRYLSYRYRDRVSFICSTFAFAALNASRREPVVLPMSEQKYEPGPHESADPLSDLLLSRWLATPSDLWRLAGAENRRDLRLDVDDVTKNSLNGAEEPGPRTPEAVIDLREQPRDPAPSRRERVAAMRYGNVASH